MSTDPIDIIIDTFTPSYDEPKPECEFDISLLEKWKSFVNESITYEIEMDENQFNIWLALLGSNPDKNIFMYRVATKMEHDGSWTFIPFEELQNGDIFILFDEFPNEPFIDNPYFNSKGLLLAIGNAYSNIKVRDYVCNFEPSIPY